MSEQRKPQVAFYHAHFFNGSETFIYHQAINPHIHAKLVAKKFISSSQLPVDSFIRFQFKRSRWDGFLSNVVALFGIDRYYFSASVNRLKELLKNEPVDVLHAQFGFSGIRILPVAKALNKPLVVSFHGLDASKLLRKRSYRNGLKEVFDYASAIVLCNPGMEKELPLLLAHKEKVKWVPYGIDMEKFSNQAKQTPSTGNLQLLHVGRLVEKKGVPDLIRAFHAARQTVKNITLNIVGNGPEEKMCKALVSRLSLVDHVIFHGWKSPDQVKEMMQENDIFILNSRLARDGDSEGLPVGMLEAMAMSMPVISTRHAGIPLVIEHGKSGLLVNERDTESLTKAIIDLTTNEAKRRAFSAEARNRVVSNFTQPHMHRRLLEIYQKVIS